MRKVVIGLMAAVAFALFSYSSFAHCGKCGMKSDEPACKTQAAQTECAKHCREKPCMAKSGQAGCGCCDKCAKGECTMAADGKPCCDKCAKGCACKCCSAGSACNKTSAADPTTQEFAPDPVCGMDVTTKDAVHTYEYEGKTYYFCSESCKNRFSKDPSKFLAQ